MLTELQRVLPTLQCTLSLTAAQRLARVLKYNRHSADHSVSVLAQPNGGNQ